MSIDDDDIAYMARQSQRNQPAPIVSRILRDVAELPDRTSPEDQPDMMLVSAPELTAILEHRLGVR